MYFHVCVCVVRVCARVRMCARVSDSTLIMCVCVCVSTKMCKYQLHADQGPPRPPPPPSVYKRAPQCLMRDPPLVAIAGGARRGPGGGESGHLCRVQAYRRGLRVREWRGGGRGHPRRHQPRGGEERGAVHRQQGAWGSQPKGSIKWSLSL